MRDIRADINARRVLEFPDGERSPLGSWKGIWMAAAATRRLSTVAQKAEGGARRFLSGAKTKGRRGSSGLRYLRILTYRNGRARLTAAVSSPLLSFFRLNRPLEMNFSSSKNPRRATGQRSHVYTLRISCNLA